MFEVEYVLPQTATFAAAVAWYERHVPRGRAWREWEWCDPVPTSAEEAGGSWAWHDAQDDTKALRLLVDEATPVTVRLAVEQRTDDHPALCAE